MRILEESESAAYIRQVMFVASFVISSLALFLLHDVSSVSRHRETSKYVATQPQVNVVVPSATFFNPLPPSAPNAM
jgi:hypothetical protein